MGGSMMGVGVGMVGEDTSRVGLVGIDKTKTSTE